MKRRRERFLKNRSSENRAGMALNTRAETALAGVLREAVREKKAAGVSVLLIREGETVLSLQEGMADRERGGRMSADTVFRLHSMTKPVLAAAAFRLMEQGRLGLEDPVSRYLPEYEKLCAVSADGQTVRAERPMRIYHLLNMTSGLVYPDESTLPGIRTGEAFRDIMSGLSTREAARRFAACPLAFEPGRGWGYGVSADVLGAVLEKIADLRLGELLRREILDPLGMSDTSFGVPTPRRERLAAVYEECPGRSETLARYEAGEIGLDYDAPEDPHFESGGAGLCGTLTDYGRFAKMLLREGLVSEDSFEGARLLRSETVRYMTGTGLAGLQQRAFDAVTMFSLGRYTYGSLMRKCLRDDVPPRIARRGEYGWGGQDGTDFVNFPAENAALLIGMQKRNARMYSLGKKIRAAVLSELI